MEMDRKWSWILIPFFGSVVFLWYGNTYTEFVPTMYFNDSFKRITVDSSFYKNLKIVFEEQAVQYKLGDAGKLLIKRKLLSDKELLWNYTEKALDTSWLNNHKSQ